MFRSLEYNSLAYLCFLWWYECIVAVTAAAASAAAAASISVEMTKNDYFCDSILIRL